MLVRAVVQHHVDDNANTGFTSFFEKKFHIFHRSEAWIYSIIISNIISIIFHG